jgi:hypothetical protein
MRRILLVAVGLILASGLVGARPVLADNNDPSSSGSLYPWVNWVGRILDDIQPGIPAPAGWHNRSVCVGNMNTNEAYCVYFPWPI